MLGDPILFHIRCGAMTKEKPCLGYTYPFEDSTKRRSDFGKSTKHEHFSLQGDRVLTALSRAHQELAFPLYPLFRA